MGESKVARRYALSLLVLAKERGINEKVYADMQLVDATCTASHDLALLLRNPIVQADKKLSVLKAIFSSKLDALTIAFMELMTKKGREGYLPAIATAYIAIYKESIGVHTAFVTSAVALDAETRDRIMVMLKQKHGNSVELVEKVDNGLIGGLVLRVGDQQYDASVSRQLRKLKDEFDDNLYVKEF